MIEYTVVKEKNSNLNSYGDYHYHIFFNQEYVITIKMTNEEIDDFSKLGILEKTISNIAIDEINRKRTTLKNKTLLIHDNI